MNTDGRNNLAVPLREFHLAELGLVDRNDWMREQPRAAQLRVAFIGARQHVVYAEQILRAV